MPKFDWSNLGPFVSAVKTACGMGAMAIGKEVQNDVKTHFAKVGRFAASSPGQPPAIKRGLLRNSILLQASGRNTAIVGSNVKYGWVHETGNDGKPIRSKKFMPIPINDAARRLLESKGTRSLTTFKMRLIRPMFGKQALLVGDAGVRTQQYVTDSAGRRRTVVRKDQPVFVLKKSIRMPKRPFMAPALARSRNNPRLTQVFAVGTTRGLAKAGFRIKVVPA
jgi:phage gpG-like protein